MTSIVSTTPRVGDPLPPIALPDLEGHNVRLEDYRGKRLLLFMWASW